MAKDIEREIEDGVFKERIQRTKAEDDRFRRIVAKLAVPLPPLPETASALAQELHQRARDMLRVRLDNVETSVNRLVDSMVQKAVEQSFTGAAHITIQRMAAKRVEALAPAILEELVRKMKDSADVSNWVVQEMRSKLDQQIRKIFVERIEEYASTTAERIAETAMKEMGRYYAASTLLVREKEGGHDD